MIPVAAPQQYRVLGRIAVVAVILCIVSVVALTLLLPDRAAGGFIPVPTAVQ